MSSFGLLIKNKIVEYETTCNFGLVSEKSENLDDYDYFKEFLIGYHLHKIKCWSDKNNGIIGIQIVYKDRETNEEIITINKHRSEDQNYQEFILKPLELITGLTIWINKSLKGFELSTNKNRFKRFGFDTGEKIIPEDFEDNNLNIILGFFFTCEPKMGFSSMGCYYLKRKYLSLILYSGILYLRIKLKDEKYKNEIKKKINDMDISDKALYMACLLPQNHFIGIIKYTLS